MATARSWVGAGENQQLTNLQGKKNKKIRLPFSISWENTARRHELICMYYTVARKYTGDLEKEPGEI